MHVVQASVVPMDSAALAAEFAEDLEPRGRLQWEEVHTNSFPPCDLLIENYVKAQDVVKNDEVFDSQKQEPIYGYSLRVTVAILPARYSTVTLGIVINLDI